VDYVNMFHMPSLTDNFKFPVRQSDLAGPNFETRKASDVEPGEIAIFGHAVSSGRIPLKGYVILKGCRLNDFS
jgi:hypothetical protein